MTPIRFGPPGKQRFGLYRPPKAGTDRGECVVLCNPFGQEAIRCHRLLRVLSERLSRSGYHVLRFDYFGTGDSDGGDADGDLQGWIDDVLLADEEVARRSGHRKSSWFGLRLGATLAALASARATHVPHRLVLWDPVVDGTDYLAALALAHEAALVYGDGAKFGAHGVERSDPPAADALTEALGFPLTPAIRAELATVSASSFRAIRAANVNLLGIETSREYSTLPALLAESGAQVSTRPIDTRIEWATDEAMNMAIVPTEALQAIVASLSQAS